MYLTTDIYNCVQNVKTACHSCLRDDTFSRFNRTLTCDRRIEGHRHTHRNTGP